jgi:hypothetical protein
MAPNHESVPTRKTVCVPSAITVFVILGHVQTPVLDDRFAPIPLDHFVNVTVGKRRSIH